MKERGITKTTLKNAISKYINNDTIICITERERLKLLNDKDIRYLENLINETPKISSKKMSNLVEKEQNKVVSEKNNPQDT